MRVLLVIAQRDFRDEEYEIPKKIFEEAGIEAITASPDGGECSGQMGGKARADIRLDEAIPKDYDAIVVAGGRGSPEYLWDNESLRKTIRDMSKEGKVIAGICLSGAALANAGVLDGVRATVYETPESIKALRQGKAEYTGEDVVVDGKFITANGPATADRFAREILKKIWGDKDI
jgi:protease I